MGQTLAKEQEFFKFHVNPGKKLEIDVNGRLFLRHAVKTHFITPEDNYINVVEKYVKDIYRDGDILAISENLIALCQNRIILKKDIKLSFWAKFLSRFVNVTPAGEAVGNPYKMQIAINQAGLLRVLFAAFLAGITRPFGIRGIFYKIVGHYVANIDGFCADSFDYYIDKGILAPENPDKVCQEIKDKLGIDTMVVDANDLGVEILGKNNEIEYDSLTLAKMIIDNPAGQGNQMTPMILIKPASVTAS
jgi:hypothetical protein